MSEAGSGLGHPYRTITLTQGRVALVDECDYELLSQRKWHAHYNERIRGYYAVHCGTNSRSVLMHREVMGLEYGDKRFVDHRIPYATLDNRRSNLRISTVAQNAHNCRLAKNNTSGFKGVCRDKRSGLWIAQITLNKCQRKIGYFSSAEEAGRAYDQAAITHFGEFAFINFPVGVAQ